MIFSLLFTLKFAEQYSQFIVVAIAWIFIDPKRKRNSMEAKNQYATYSVRTLIATVVILLAGIILRPNAVTATIYYVATTGNDANPGTLSTPFRTIQKAADIITPGDTVVVKDGVYTDTNKDDIVVYVRRGGNSTAWVTFRAENPLAAIVDGQNNTAAKGWHISAPYIHIEGFEVRNSFRHGFMIYADNVNLIKNHIHHIGRYCTDSAYGIDGVFLSMNSNIKIEKNILHNIGRHEAGENGCSPSTPYYQNNDHGIYIASSEYIEVSNNVFYDINRGWPIHIYDGSSSKGSSNLKIFNNTFAFANPYRDGHIYLARPSVFNTVIQNNIFYQPRNTAIIIKDSLLSDSNRLIDVTISNNITYGGPISLVTSSNVTFSNNLTIDPKFINTSAKDFHLQAISPAIDAGIAVSEVTTDFDGISRPKLVTYDIGAYEYQYTSERFSPPTNLRILSSK
jgi:hypothetical protein